MKKSNYTFEVHVYAPELNKVYLKRNITGLFSFIQIRCLKSLFIPNIHERISRNKKGFTQNTDLTIETIRY